MKEEASIKIKNWINGRSCDDGVTSWFDKHNPHSEELLCEVANSPAAVVGVAVNQAQLAFFEVGETLGKDYTIKGKYQVDKDLNKTKKKWIPDNMLPKMWKDREVLK